MHGSNIEVMPIFQKIEKDLLPKKHETIPFFKHIRTRKIENINKS